eukprot:Gb_22327 [translate_table: standard]
MACSLSWQVLRGSMVLLLLLVWFGVCGRAGAVGSKSRVSGISGNFLQDFDISWAPDHVKLLDGGNQLQLVLDRSTGSGFVSKKSFLFGNIGMQIKLVPGDSAGTVTAYYLSSKGPNHDEIDFEFLGNVSGEPYILQTNVYAHGAGNREQRIYLWFDPTTNFHTYSVLWNPHHIIFYVDGTPIRVFKNNEAMGVPYPNRQPMGIYSSLWNADDWATRGGLVKTDWSKAPFIASYKNFRVEGGCEAKTPTDVPKCASQQVNLVSNENRGIEALDNNQRTKLNWVRKNYLIYDYCTDKSRYPVPPAECRSRL